MKRKIALALALVVAFATIMPATLFASTYNSLTGQGIVGYADNTLLVDGQKGFNSTVSYQPTATIPDVTNYVNQDGTLSNIIANNGLGSAVVVRFNDNDYAQTGLRSFKVALSGAYWAFYQSSSTNLFNVNDTAVSPAVASATGINPLLSRTFGNGLVATTGLNFDGSVPTPSTANGPVMTLATDGYMLNQSNAAWQVFTNSATYTAAVTTIGKDLQDKLDALVGTAAMPTNNTLQTLLSSGKLPTTVTTLSGAFQWLLSQCLSTIQTDVSTSVMDAYNAISVASNVPGQIGNYVAPIANSSATSYYNAVIGSVLNTLANGGTFAGSTLTVAADGTAAATATTAIGSLLTAANLVTVVNGLYSSVNSSGNTVIGGVPTPMPGAGSVYATQYVGNAQYQGQTTNNATPAQAVNYMVSIDSSNIATVYFSGAVQQGDLIILPIVAVTSGTGTVTASIQQQAGTNVTPTMTNPLVVSGVSGQGISMTTTADTSTDANYRMFLQPVAINELTLNQIQNNGWFYIDAPVGYHFTNASGDGSLSITTSYNLPGTVTTTYGGYAWRPMGGQPTDSAYSIPDPTVIYNSTGNAMTSVGSAPINVNLSTVYNPSTANSRLYFYFNGANKGGALANITVSGLIIVPDNPLQAPYNVSMHMTGGNIGLFATTQTNWDLPIDARQNWGIVFDTTTPGTVVNGFSGWVNMAQVSPWNNQVALAAYNPLAISNPIDVTFSENTINSWWLAKNTTFSLVDANGNPLPNVKFSQFQAYSTNLTPAFGNPTTWDRTTLTDPTVNGAQSRFSASGSTNAYFSADDSSVTFFDLSRSAQNDKASIEMKFYLSAEANFSGDIYLAVNSDAIGNSQINQTKVKIATFVPAVTVATSTTNVQIGYQSYSVSDVAITEAQPGLIQSGQVMSLYLGEYGDGLQTPYMYFGPVTSANMSTDGSSNIGISSLAVSGGAANLGAGGALTNNISLSITTRSNTPSSSADTATYAAATITLKNLIVNIDRNTPYGNYDFIVGGPAVSNNCAYGIPAGIATTNTLPAAASNTDCFPTMGVVYQNYLDVQTPGSNVPFSSRVVVTPGSSTALVGPADSATSFDMTVNAFIDDQTNRLMVPIRFVSTALGVDPLNVRWDGTSGTATIWTNEKVISFVEGSSVMTINNTPFQLQNSDGTPVIPQIYTASDGSSRMFIPFTALGQAIGIQVVWDATDGYAIYNPTPDELAAYPTSTVTTATTDTTSTDTTDASSTTTSTTSGS